MGSFTVFLLFLNKRFCRNEFARKYTLLQKGGLGRKGAERMEKNATKPGGHSRKKIDLTGQRFGRLTVLRPAENIGGRTAWVCRCDCGRETTAKTYHLRSGHTASCGCAGPRAADSPLGLTYIDGACVEMLRAKTVRRNNTSGAPGVDWRASKNSWRASICFKGRRYYLGSFARFEDAVKARQRAEEELHNKFLSEFAARQAEMAQSAADS